MASLLDLISANLVTTIETISVANGYANNLSKVSGGGGGQRFQQAGQVLATLPTVVVQETGESKEIGPDGVGAGSYSCSASYELDVITTTPSGASSTASHVLGLVSDVEKALRVDRHRGQGAAVIETRLGGHEPIVEVDENGGIAYVGATLRVTVVYRHNAADPGVGWPP